MKTCWVCKKDYTTENPEAKLCSACLQWTYERFNQCLEEHRKEAARMDAFYANAVTNLIEQGAKI